MWWLFFSLSFSFLFILCVCVCALHSRYSSFTYTHNAWFCVCVFFCFILYARTNTIISSLKLSDFFFCHSLLLFFFIKDVLNVYCLCVGASEIYINTYDMYAVRTSSFIYILKVLFLFHVRTTEKKGPTRNVSVCVQFLQRIFYTVLLCAIIIISRTFFRHFFCIRV